MNAAQRLENLENRMSFIEKITAISVKNYLTMDEAVAYSGISESQLYKLTASRKIPFSKPGGKLIFFHKKDLEHFLNSNRKLSQGEISVAADAHIQKLTTKKKHKSK